MVEFFCSLYLTIYKSYIYESVLTLLYFGKITDFLALHQIKSKYYMSLLLVANLSHVCLSFLLCYFIMALSVILKTAAMAKYFS